MIMCKEQSLLFKETEEWTDCPALRKRDSWGESTETIY